MLVRHRAIARFAHALSIWFCTDTGGSAVNRSIGLIVVALATSALVASGCSSSSGPKAPTGSASGSGASGAPLVFGSDGGLNGSAGTPGFAYALRAYFADWNKRGGYKGRPVEIVTTDAGATSATNVAAIQKLVNASKVLALVGSDGPLDCSAGGPTITDAGIALISIPIDASCFGLPNAFPVESNGAAGGAALAYDAFKRGARRICLTFPDVPTVATSISNGLKKAIAKFGDGAALTYSSFAPVAFTAADAATFIAQVSQHHCDAVQVDATLANTQLILAAAAQAGIYPNKGIFFAAPTAYTPGGIAAIGPTAQGLYVDSPTLPAITASFAATAGPEVKQAAKVLAAVPKQYQDSWAQLGYEAGWLMEHTLNQMSGPITRANILSTLKTEKLSLPLSVGEFDYTQTNVSATSPRVVPAGASILKVQGNDFVVVDKWVSTS